nr:hypothetical protein GCM10020093_064610 [Planobispora longispora]
MAPDFVMEPMTGVPVTEGASEPSAEPGSSAEPTAGSEHRWPVVLPSGNVWSWVADLQELVETPQRTTTQEGATETIGLRTDVLFAFDQAKLSAEAAAVLDEVVEETRRRADPAKPPVVIEGHTDAKGSDSYNEALSIRRARAVQAYFARELGTGYRYEVAGKGEKEPIARNEKQDGGDNPEGRARNRRVEISYQIKQQGPDVTTTAGPSADDVRGSTREPAPSAPTPARWSAR